MVTKFPHGSPGHKPTAGQTGQPQDTGLSLSEFQRRFPTIEELEAMENLRVTDNEHSPNAPQHPHIISNSTSRPIPVSIFSKRLPASHFDPTERPSSTPIAPSNGVLMGQATPRNQQSVPSVTINQPRQSHRKGRHCTMCHQLNCRSGSLCGGDFTLSSPVKSLGSFG